MEHTPEEKDERLEKVLFEFQSNLIDETVVEPMWAIKVDPENGLYQLDSIPFHGPLIATDDLFYAEYSAEDEGLKYVRTEESSGNSVIQVILLSEEANAIEIQDKLEALDCVSENLNEQFFSVEVVREVNYLKVRELLDNYLEKELIDYAEPCLSEKHQKDVGE